MPMVKRGVVMVEIKSAYADLKNPLYEVIDELMKLQARMDNLDLKLNLILEKLACVSISSPSSSKPKRS